MAVCVCRVKDIVAIGEAQKLKRKRRKWAKAMQIHPKQEFPFLICFSSFFVCLAFASRLARSLVHHFSSSDFVFPLKLRPCRAKAKATQKLHSKFNWDVMMMMWTERGRETPTHSSSSTTHQAPNNFEKLKKMKYTSRTKNTNTHNSYLCYC